MPRFFLHLHNGIGLSSDEVGTDLPDQNAARVVAIDGIRGIVSEEALNGQLDLAGYVDINDGEGNHLLKVDFCEAFELRLRDSRTNS